MNIEKNNIHKALHPLDDPTPLESKSSSSAAAPDKQIEDHKACQHLSHLSREMRSPLNAILGVLQMLRDTHLTKDQTHLTGIIEENTYGLLGVMNDVLCIADMESAAPSPFITKAFNVRELIHRAAISLNAAAKERGLNTLLWIDKNVPHSLKGDALQVEHALKTQIEKMLSMVPRGEIAIKITSHQTYESQAFLQITFKMTWPTVEDPIFNNRSDFKSSFTPYLKLWERLGGSVGFNYEKKGEATLFIKIPFKKANNQDLFVSHTDDPGMNTHAFHAAPQNHPNEGDTLDKKSQPAPNSKAPLEKGSTILVVEDNPINQKVVMHILKKLGYEASVVDHGKAAIDLLVEKQFDLILMDIQMPEMDGLEATRVIRDPNSNVRWHDVPIIAVTAHALKSDRERCFNAGMNDHVAKPVSSEILKKKIAHWLKVSAESQMAE